MRAVLLDFNGTMFFDTSLHMEAWSKIYQELHPEDTAPLDTSLICGPNNDSILQKIGPWLSAEQRRQVSEHKEELYRQVCKSKGREVRLVNGVPEFLQYLQDHRIPYALASASIKTNIDFYFETFGLDRWFRLEDVVYDDGNFRDKGAMHLEAARRLNVDIADCLLIEDSPTSIALAKQAGAGCIVAIGNTASVAELVAGGANHYISDFSKFDYTWLE